MKTLIIYVSLHHGNTGKVAHAMANAVDAVLLQVKQADADMVSSYDSIGLGSGIYFGKHHGSLLEFVDKLPVTENKRAFVFSTSGLRRMWLVHDFNRALEERLRNKGFDVIGEFSCRGLDTYRATGLAGGVNRGRPNVRDLQRAQDFARGLRNHKPSGLS
jgi:flavodoxin